MWAFIYKNTVTLTNVVLKVALSNGKRVSLENVKKKYYSNYWQLICDMMGLDYYIYTIYLLHDPQNVTIKTNLWVYKLAWRMNLGLLKWGAPFWVFSINNISQWGLCHWYNSVNKRMGCFSFLFFKSGLLYLFVCAKI